MSCQFELVEGGFTKKRGSFQIAPSSTSLSADKGRLPEIIGTGRLTLNNLSTSAKIINR